MTRKHKTAIALLAVALMGAGAYWWWVQGNPRRESLETLTQLDLALRGGGKYALPDLLVVPANIRDRSVPEQLEFLTKTLNDEISAEGLAALKRRGSYGPLKQIFPAEAETWAKRAGVKPDDCVAFGMERGGVRCEVVLVKPAALDSSPGRSAAQASQPSTQSAPYRILRVNNVKQMAESQLLATEKTK